MGRRKPAKAGHAAVPKKRHARKGPGPTQAQANREGASPADTTAPAIAVPVRPETNSGGRGGRPLSEDDAASVSVGRDPASTSVPLPPVAVLRLSKHGVWPPQQRLKAEVLFRYGRATVESSEPAGRRRRGRGPRKSVQRMPEAESGLRAALTRHRCIVPDSFGRGEMALTAKLVPVLSQLLAEGWEIESEGQPVRSAARVHCRVSSGVDWFDLRNMLLIGRAVVESALSRNESRGAHQREDHPGLMEEWTLNQFVEMDGETLSVVQGSAASDLGSPI